MARRIGRPKVEVTGGRVLLVADSVTGHRLLYLRLIAEEAVSRGTSVVIAVPQDLISTDEFRLHLGALFSHVTVRTYSGRGLKALESLANSVHPDLTVNPDGDAILMPLLRWGWSGAGRLNILVMRPHGQSNAAWRRRIQTGGKALVRAVARHRRRVNVVALASATATLPRGAWVRDPITMTASPTSVSEVRSQFGLDADVYWYGIVGTITRRKNVPIVATALGLIDGRVGLVLAGKSTLPAGEYESEMALLRQRGARVVVIDRLLDDWEIDAIVAAVDCVVLAHSNEGPSGILGKAMTAGTVVVGAGAQSLRRDCEEVGDGAIWVPLAPAALADGLRAAQELVAEASDGNHAEFAGRLLA